MKRITCEYNIDTACVELRLDGELILAVDCIVTRCPGTCTSVPHWTGWFTTRRWNTWSWSCPARFGTTCGSTPTIPGWTKRKILTREQVVLSCSLISSIMRQEANRSAAAI